MSSDPWGFVRAWRERRAAMVKHHPPTYDAYPGHDEEPDLWLAVSGRDAYGRIRTRIVDLEGYSLHQLNPKPYTRRGNTTVAEWLFSRVIETWVPLAITLSETRRAKRGG